jgi:hypothetical protein
MDITFFPYFLELKTLIVNGRSSSDLLVYLYLIASIFDCVEKPSCDESPEFLTLKSFCLFQVYLSTSG